MDKTDVMNSDEQQDEQTGTNTAGYEGEEILGLFLTIKYKNSEVHDNFVDWDEKPISSIIDYCLKKTELGCELTMETAALCMHFHGDGITKMENSKMVKEYMDDLNDNNNFMFCEIVHKDDVIEKEPYVTPVEELVDVKENQAEGQ